MLARLLSALALAAILATLPFAVSAQSSVRPPEQPADTPRAGTGGAPTLEDILARQRGQQLDNGYRTDRPGAFGGAPPGVPDLATRGDASDSDVWRALRFGRTDVSVTPRGLAASTVIQDGGMWWLNIRRGPLLTYGGWLLAGTLVLLALFYLIRGRIRIEGPITGRKILRFTFIERFGHWLLAGSFLVLGITGLISLFGRKWLIPTFGHESFAGLAWASKWVHNNVAWAFMLGLVLVIVNWITQNIPNRHDLKWIAVGGGLFSKNVHPPAKKFNAGQKLIFWGVVVLGLSISASGLSLLFPFELPMFAKTFALLNDTGAPGWIGAPPLPELLSPQEEMQYAQLWHAIVAFLFLAMIFAHIYIGSIGMEGAFDAMGSGEVEEQWAREHHGLWVEEVREKQAGHAATRPAE